MIGGSVVLFGKNRDSEIGLWLPKCTRYARTILLTTANFRTLFFPNSTTDPPITYTNSTPNVALFKTSIKNYTYFFCNSIPKVALYKISIKNYIYYF